MTSINLPYLHRYRDARGKVRVVFNRRGYPKRTLPLPVGCPEFLQKYNELLRESEKGRTRADGVAPGSFDALLKEFYVSRKFPKKPSTARVYRLQLENWRAKTNSKGETYGSRPVKALTSQHVEKMLTAMSETPHHANNWLKRMKALLRFSVHMGYRRDNPVDVVYPLSLTREQRRGHKAWPPEFVERFRSHHKLGTIPRLAFELLAETAFRLGDAARVGPAHRAELSGQDMLRIEMDKTGDESCVVVSSALRAAIDSLDRAGGTPYLLSSRGTPFAKAALGNEFRKWRRAAKIPEGYSAHGLRAYHLTKYIDAGADPLSVRAVSGHKDDRMLNVYIKSHDRVKRAISAATAAGTVNTEGPVGEQERANGRVLTKGKAVIMRLFLRVVVVGAVGYGLVSAQIPCKQRIF